jgi:hypothetical protein
MKKPKTGDWVYYNLSLWHVIGDWGDWGTEIDNGCYRKVLDDKDLKVTFPLTQDNLKRSWGFIDAAEELCSYYIWNSVLDLWKHRAVIRRAWELALQSNDPKYAEKQMLNMFKYHKVIMNRRKK